MKLIAYVPDGTRVDIRPAPLQRPWMGATSERFEVDALCLAGMDAPSIFGADQSH
jgi:hypothetical protein